MLGGMHKAPQGRHARRAGLVLLLVGAAFGVGFAAFITGRVPRASFDPLLVFAVTGGGTLLLVPAGLALWIVGAAMDRKRPRPHPRDPRRPVAPPTEPSP